MSVKTILVVDDDREWNLLLKMKLDRAGYKAEQAFNGKEAIEKISAKLPDLVLCDITMPVMDGWEVCEKLRSQEETQSLPIVILSSFSRPEDVQKGKSFQVQRYLVKPCSPESIIQNVKDVLAPKG